MHIKAEEKPQTCQWQTRDASDVETEIRLLIWDIWDETLTFPGNILSLAADIWV